MGESRTSWMGGSEASNHAVGTPGQCLGGDPSPSWRPEASHVPLCLSTTSGAVSSWFQMEDVPCVFQKPVSGNLAQNGHHKSLSPRKPYSACMVPCSGNARDSSQILIWGGAGPHTREPQSDRARHRCSQPTTTRKGFESSQRGQPGWRRGKGGYGMVLDSYGGGHRWVAAAGGWGMGGG